jgi:hypothetical protein
MEGMMSSNEIRQCGGARGVVGDGRTLEGALAGWLKLVVGIAVLCLLAGCGESAQGTTSAPWNIHVTIDRYKYSSPASMCGSLLIADATVKAHGQPHWNSANSLRPNLSTEQQVIDQGYTIYTPVLLEKMNAIYDKRTQDSKEFASIGGRVGADSVQVDGLPQVKDGSRYLIAFNYGNIAGKGKTEDWLTIFDVFSIDTQDIVTLSTEQQKETKIPLKDLGQSLAQCK